MGNISDGKRPDAMLTGYSQGMSGPLSKYTECQLMFKGALITDATFQRWEEKIGEVVSLPGLTSMQWSLEATLDQCFTKITKESKLKSVVFVFLISNYYGI